MTIQVCFAIRFTGCSMIYAGPGIEMNKLKYINRIFKVFTFTSCVFCSCIYFSPSWAKDITIHFDGRKMSADIEGVFLGEVFEKILAQRKFSVRGDKSILYSEISVKFADLSFQDGLKKILGQINYILLFDKNKEPSGVILVDSGSFVSTTKASSEKKEVEGASGGKKYLEPADTDTPLPGPTPVSDLTPPTKEELTAMEVIKDAPTPGGPVEVSEQELENFKVMASDTPPGGVVEVTPEELESMNPAGDSQSTENPGINKN